MGRFPLPLTKLIHENLGIVMCFAFSRGPLEAMVRTQFGGEWKYLHKAILELPETRAQKACIELALFLRILDDEIGISTIHSSSKSIPCCGKLTLKNGRVENLPFREAANKIIHSSRIEWEFGESSTPTLICTTRKPEKWTKAEIDLVGLASVCGQLIS